MIKTENFPEAECSECGAGLAVSGREENGQVVISVEPSEIRRPGRNAGERR